MAKIFIEESTLSAIGNSIRAKTGKANMIPPLNMPTEIESIQTTGGGSGGGSGGGQAFQCGTVVSADGTNLVVPCTLDNILIVRKYVSSTSNMAYLLNATLLVADGLKIQIGNNSSGNLTNQGIEAFSITKQNGQTTFTQTTSNKFNGEYCYIAWDNAE